MQRARGSQVTLQRSHINTRSEALTSAAGSVIRLTSALLFTCCSHLHVGHILGAAAPSVLAPALSLCPSAPGLSLSAETTLVLGAVACGRGGNN